MFAASLWALDALIRTELTKTISPSAIVFFEHLVGSVLLFPFFWKARSTIAVLTKRDWVTLLLLTIVSSVMGTIFFTAALGKSFATGDFVTPLLLQKLQPIIVIALAAVFLKERLTPRFLFFTPVALLGSYLISFGTNPITLQFTGKELIVLLSLGAAASWGVGTILSKKILHKLPYLPATGLRFFAAVPISALAALFLGQTIFFGALTPESMFRFILIAVTTGAGALVLYYKGLSKTDASVATISELMFPFISILIAITPLNPYGAAQTLTPANILGIVLLVGSVLAISLDYAKRTNRQTFTGHVVKGSGDGKKIGFPTINIKPTAQPAIGYGVYATWVDIEKTQYTGVLHYGPRLVFGETHPQWEVHILNFHKRIYGKSVRVEILKFLRPTRSFDSVKKLEQQINEDIKNTKKFLAKQIK